MTRATPEPRIQITNANTTVVGNNLGASWEPGDLIYAYYGGQSIWWTWTAPQSGRVSFITQSSNTPMLHIYTGSVVSKLKLLPGQYGGPWDEIDDLAFDVTAGTSYAICADGRWNDDGSIAFTLNFMPRPANDDFADSIILTGTNTTVTGDNRLATCELGEFIRAGTVGRSVWYTWTAPTRGLATISVARTNFAPVVAVYTGTSVMRLDLISTNSATGQSFLANAGTRYQIKVDGGGSVFTLNLSLVTARANDAFESRFMLSGMNPTVDGTTFLASSQPGEPNFYPWVVDRCVWYSWIAPADGAARVHCPDRPIAVYSGGRLANLTTVASVNPAAFDDLFFPATKGMEYEIAVTGASWLPDAFTLSIVMPKAQIAGPTNGSAFACSTNIEIVARTIDIEGTVVSVSFFDGTNLLGTVTDAPFQMEYRDATVGAHTLSLQSLDENGLATISEPIEIRVKPVNDDFAQRIALNGSSAIFSGDNSGATSQTGEILPCGASGRTLWWT